MYFFCSIIIIDNINALSTQNEIKNESKTKNKSQGKLKHKNKNKKETQMPNLNNMSSFQQGGLQPQQSYPQSNYQPQQSYKPQGGYSNYSNKKPEIEMLKAKTLGNQRRSMGGIGGANQKPAIWETIKTNRTPFGQGQANSPFGQQIPNSFGQQQQPNYRDKNTMSIGGEAMNLLKRENDLKKFGQGSMSVPVKLEMSNKFKNNPSFANYENPSFLQHKSDKKPKGSGPHTINVPKMPMITPALIAASQKDVKLIKKKLHKAHTKKQKLKALIFSKKVLKNGAKKLQDKIKKEIGKVLGAKKTAINLSNTMNKIALQIKKENASKLKLTDRIKVKNQLKHKIFREVEGFRDTGKAYTLLRKVNRKDLRKILNQIKARLGF